MENKQELIIDARIPMKKLASTANLCFIFTLFLFLSVGCSSEDDLLAPSESGQVETDAPDEGEEDSSESDGDDGGGEESSDGEDQSDGNTGNTGEGTSGGVQVDSLSSLHVLDRIAATNELSLFQEALITSDLSQNLGEVDTLTVFAPTDTAV